MATSFNSRLSTAPEEGCKAPCVTVSTSNIILSGEQTISSVAVVTDDRVLVAGQTDTTENGIYVANSSSWARAKDWNAAEDVVSGVIVPVNSPARIYIASFSGEYTAGTTAVNFTNIVTDLNPISVSTVATMVTLSPVAGEVCVTTGYYDGWAAFLEPMGGARYVAATLAQVRTVRGISTWVPDELINITAANGLVWMYLRDSIPNLHQAGAKGDGSTMDTASIKAASYEWIRWHANKGTYLTGEPFVFGDGNVRHISGDGWYETIIRNSASDVIEMGRRVTGTHDGANDLAYLSDSTATFDVNEFSKTTIVNSTDSSAADITSNTATTVVATLSGGTQNDWDTGDAYVIGNDASASIIEGITLHSGTGGGHIFEVKNAVSFFTLRNFKLLQDNPTKCLWHQTAGYCGGNVAEKGHMVAASSGTMTINPWFVQSDEITNGWAFRDLRCDYSRNGFQFFKIDSTSASSFTSQGEFTNITFELTYGGDIWLGGCKGVEMTNVGTYDLSSEQDGHGIFIGKSSTGVASSRCEISRKIKHPTGGYTMASGIQDIYLESAGATNTIIETCFNSTTDFKIDFNNNKCLMIDRPSNSESTYLNDGNVSVIDINGDYEGMLMPAYRILPGTSSRELTIASGSITPTKLFHNVDTEANAASDDLDTIVTTYLNIGDVITLVANNTARTVVLKTGTGNITLPKDISLDSTNDSIQLLWNGTKFTLPIADAEGASVENVTDGGAMSVLVDQSDLTTTTPSNFTLAAGKEGQIKVIRARTISGTATVTPYTMHGGTSVALTAAGQNLTFRHTESGWMLLSNPFNCTVT